MIRGSMNIAIATALLAGCSAAPTAITSASAPSRSTVATPEHAPSLQVMRTLFPASLTTQQAKTLLLKVDPSKIYLPSHAQDQQMPPVGQSYGQSPSISQGQSYGQAPKLNQTPDINQGQNQNLGAQGNQQQPNTTPLTPPSRGIQQPGNVGGGYGNIGGGYGNGFGGYGGYGGYGNVGGIGGFPGISGFYPFDYLGSSWYAPYYLNAGSYYPYAFSSLWTGAYPWLATPFWGLGSGSYSYAPFGYGLSGYGGLGYGGLGYGGSGYGGLGCGC